MKKAILLLVVLIPLMTGCYHAQITTGLEASNEVYQKAWATSLIAGLVPPDMIDATEHCDNGVAKVETRHSFLNLVAQAITFSIYSPMEITVTCAAGMADASAGNETLELAKTSSKEEVNKTFKEAVTRSAETDKPVYIQFK